MYPRYNPTYAAASGRRAPPPDRLSTDPVDYSSSYDPAYSRYSRDGYTSPRASMDRGGVIPISTETYRNGVPIRTSRNSISYDNYNDRQPVYNDGVAPPRRAVPPPSTVSTSSSSRLQPTVIHDQGPRQSSPMPRNAIPVDREYYSIPASSKPTREHRRVYSIDNRRNSRLLQDSDRDEPDRTVPRVRRESFDRQGYHLSGPRTRPSGVDNSSGYEYTDPRGMYDETEPRWRSRGGSVGSDRPTSMYDMVPPAKSSGRDLGPPPATKGLEKIKDPIGRSVSTREPVRSPHRDRNREYYSQDDAHDVHFRRGSMRAERPQYYDRDGDYPVYRDRGRGENEDRRESWQPVQRYEDRDVSTRGFGIRPSSVDAFTPHEHVRDSISIDPLSREPPIREIVEPPRIDVTQDDMREVERPRDRDRLSGKERDRDPPRQQDREATKEREKDRDLPLQRDRNAERDRERPRDAKRESDRGSDLGRRPREKDADDEPERPKYSENERKISIDDAVAEKGKTPRERNRDDDKSHDDRNIVAGLAGAGAVAAAAAYGAHEYADKKNRDPPHAHVEDDPEEMPSPRRETEPKEPEVRQPESPGENTVRERHYVKKEDLTTRGDSEKEKRAPEASEALDPDEEYRRRMQQEMEKLRKPRAAKPQSDEDTDSDRRRNGRRNYESESPRDDVPREYRPERELRRANPEDDAREPDYQHDRHDSIMETAIVDEPGQIPENTDSRVLIVEPPREKAAPKGILRKPTEKFPDYPNPTREGVAPLKDSKKDAPEGAKWTKVSRDIVNPAALAEGNERFEERRDVVIVLRVLTKEEVQKYANRTQEIRLEREREYERRDRRHHHRDGHRHRHDGPDEDDYDRNFDDD